MQKKWLSYWKSMFLLIVIILVLSPYFLGKPSENVHLNQHYIESLDDKFSASSFQERLHRSWSFYTFMLNSMKELPDNNITFDDQEKMFDYLFAHIPSYAIVYPTEMYYYYRFTVQDINVSGNLRLVELENGKLGMGYFDMDHQEHFNHRFFTEDDGLIIDKKFAFTYTLTYKGKSVTFVLSDIFDDPPKKVKLLPEETFVAKVRDESGIILYLLFNTETEQFYYVLDEERTVIEVLEKIDESLVVGKRTSFAYYVDPNFERKVLFGILDFNVYLNNYFDGPFDQVPPFLSIREKIYKAYPYTQLGGVDEYGNFVNQESTRVAISAYQKYHEVEELQQLIKLCEEEDEPMLVWSCLTYEEKKHYHLDSPLFYENGTLKPEDEKILATNLEE